MTASTENSLMMSFCARLMKPEGRVEQELHLLRLEARVLLERLKVAQSRLRRLAHGLWRVRGASFRHQEQHEPLELDQAFAQVRDLLVLAAERVEGLGIDPAARALVALGSKRPARDGIELDADLVQRPGGAIDNGVDKTDRHRVGVQRLGRNFAQPLAEELEGVAGIVAHGDQRFRTEDEGDVSDVGRAFRFADDAGVQVAHAIFGVVGFGGLSEVGIRA